ncbi:hypothetical protein RRG08_040094 [Elysia crispata]|uniref:Uncharacterized protein n=1 Tax=Elysia crispata TaxID=231223 RepID=A0AAE0XXD2_9GAST|nr:hypothetical protein RRG08_040094 [Elysia crispata]
MLSHLNTIDIDGVPDVSCTSLGHDRTTHSSASCAETPTCELVIPKLSCLIMTCVVSEQEDSHHLVINETRSRSPTVVRVRGKKKHLEEREQREGRTRHPTNLLLSRFDPSCQSSSSARYALIPGPLSPELPDLERRDPYMTVILLWAALFPSENQRDGIPGRCCG